MAGNVNEVSVTQNMTVDAESSITQNTWRPPLWLPYRDLQSWWT